MDHRGTGRSTPLMCSLFQNLTGNFDGNMKKCLRELNKIWGNKLNGFSTENAARDLKYAIDSTKRTPNDEVLKIPSQFPCLSPRENSLCWNDEPNFF